VAVLLGISERAVRAAEKSALKKLFNHPMLRQAWEQFLKGDLLEGMEKLRPDEEAALVALARTRTELNVILKALWIFQSSL
jgi:hypothetical protein